MKLDTKSLFQALCVLSWRPEFPLCEYGFLCIRIIFVKKFAWGLKICCAGPAFKPTFQIPIRITSKPKLPLRFKPTFQIQVPIRDPFKIL
jgi:hypothetical protein